MNQVIEFPKKNSPSSFDLILQEELRNQRQLNRVELSMSKHILWNVFIKIILETKTLSIKKLPGWFQRMTP